ncbi:MAG: hypothetical protein HYZ15_07530 [Sphingobacteriales bacterium]|nr:hypothetical protein [Sphingobacteriales bacterium]
MKKRLVFFLLCTSFFMSCDQTNRLSEEDYKWMPYCGNETLVFKSNTEHVDTIFLLKKDTFLAYPEAQSISGIKHEVVSVFCKHTDPNHLDEKHRYLENNFVQIQKNKNSHAEINILLSARDSRFYHLSPIKIDSLNREKPSTLQTRYGHYDDVYVIHGEDYLGNYYGRSNFITKIYWSKSQGLIRYDKKDTVFWELLMKY